MAYTPATMQAVMQSIAGPSIWAYACVDAATDAKAANYFSNGSAIGMMVGDLVYGTVSGADPTEGYLLVVSAVAAGGAATGDEYLLLST